MKRIISIGLAIVCCLTILVYAVPTGASAAKHEIHISDLNELDSDTVFTMDEVLALLQEAYDKGYKDGKGGASSSRSLFGDSVDYILNTNSKKFHYPDCRSAASISPKNREEYVGSRDVLIEMGYVPCKNCNP